jgi:hypothetical protein
LSAGTRTPGHQPPTPTPPPRRPRPEAGPTASHKTRRHTHSRLPKIALPTGVGLLYATSSVCSSAAFRVFVIGR